MLTRDIPVIPLKRGLGSLTRHKRDEPLTSFIGGPRSSNTVYPLVLWVFIHHQFLHLYKALNDRYHPEVYLWDLDCSIGHRKQQ